jgi:hypothetical protein
MFAAVDITAVAFSGWQSVLILSSYLSRTFQIHGMLIQFNSIYFVYLIQKGVVTHRI